LKLVVLVFNKSPKIIFLLVLQIMYDAKIFADIKGIFSWMEKRNELDQQRAERGEEARRRGDFRKIRADSETFDCPQSLKTIKEFLNMINVNATEVS